MEWLTSEGHEDLFCTLYGNKRSKRSQKSCLFFASSGLLSINFLHVFNELEKRVSGFGYVDFICCYNFLVKRIRI